MNVILVSWVLGMFDLWIARFPTLIGCATKAFGERSTSVVPATTKTVIEKTHRPSHTLDMTDDRDDMTVRPTHTLDMTDERDDETVRKDVQRGDPARNKVESERTNPPSCLSTLANVLFMATCVSLAVLTSGIFLYLYFSRRDTCNAMVRSSPGIARSSNERLSSYAIYAQQRQDDGINGVLSEKDASECTWCESDEAFCGYEPAM